MEAKRCSFRSMDAMITIRFSNLYIKMPPVFERLVLAGLKLVNLEDIYPAFLEADTAIVGGGHFPLSSGGRYMILRLDTNGRIWQTIRRWTPQKEAYYHSRIGEAVRC